MKPHLEEAHRMLGIADRDIAAYWVLRNSDDVHFSVICFHAQQAVEKSLKAALFCKRIEFRRTHELLTKHDVLLPLPVEAITSLTPCAVTLRYDDVEVEVAHLSIEDLDEVVPVVRQWAEDILRLASLEE
jgi:HEPN domain-containing protein